MSDPTDNLVLLPGVSRPTDTGTEPGLRAGPPPPDLLIPALEACLFSMPGVLSLLQLASALGVETIAVRVGLEALAERLIRTGSGLRLVEVGEGWQLRTEPRVAPWVAVLRGGRPFRLSRAALETLAIIAFRQPVPKSLVDEVRGVDSGAVLKMLLERGLIRSMGRAEDSSRSLTWGTTPQFLHTFGLRSLADLPTLRDLRALQQDDPASSAVTPSNEILHLVHDAADEPD